MSSPSAAFATFGISSSAGRQNRAPDLTQADAHEVKTRSGALRRMTRREGASPSEASFVDTSRGHDVECRTNNPRESPPP